MADQTYAPRELWPEWGAGSRAHSLARVIWSSGLSPHFLPGIVSTYSIERCSYPRALHFSALELRSAWPLCPAREIALCWPPRSSREEASCMAESAQGGRTEAPVVTAQYRAVQTQTSVTRRAQRRRGRTLLLSYPEYSSTEINEGSGSLVSRALGIAPSLFLFDFY